MEEVAQMVKLDCETVDEYGKEQARRAFADTIGVSFQGLAEPVYRKILEFCRTKGQGSMPAPGLESKVDVFFAALSWGALFHAIDFDDIALEGHPSAVLLPAVLTVAYRYGKTGREALNAYICGYEALHRFAVGASVKQFDNGWHTTATTGVMGATVAVCRLMGLEVEQTMHALGIAASMAAGLQANIGTMTKPLHAGFAAANATMAAELASLGVNSAGGTSDLKNAFFRAYGGEYRSIPLSHRFIENGVIVKFYPSCGRAARANDLALEARENHKVKPEDVKSIECRITQASSNCLRYVRPSNGTEARFSLEYCVAQSLIDGLPRLRHFGDEFVRTRVSSEPMNSLIDKIHRVVPESLKQDVSYAEEYFEMNIELYSGHIVKLHANQPKGFPSNPLSESELESKFRDCAEGFISSEDAGRFFHALRHIDVQKNFRDLIDDIVSAMSAGLSGVNT
jgi:2-methylcitrate dehydratase PrpD